MEAADGGALVAVDPVHHAIEKLIAATGEHWEPVHADEETDSQRIGRCRCTMAGLVRQRCTLQVSCAPLPGELLVFVESDGLVSDRWIAGRIRELAPTSWRSPDGAWLGQPRHKLEPTQIMLTADGVRARGDVQRGDVEPLRWLTTKGIRFREQPEPREYDAPQFGHGPDTGPGIFATLFAKIGAINIGDNRTQTFIYNSPAQPSEASVPKGDDGGAADIDDDQNTDPPVCYVTLRQMAAIVSRQKRTLRRLYDSGELPSPAIEGLNGQPHEWLWDDVRPILEEKYGRNLPRKFPADRFVDR